MGREGHRLGKRGRFLNAISWTGCNPEFASRIFNLLEGHLSTSGPHPVHGGDVIRGTD